MKQTVAILTALLLSLMVLTGFILTGSMKQTELIAQRDEMLASLRQEHQSLVQEQLQTARELKQTICERDALSLQLNDAVLASQEANEAVALQLSQQEQLKEALEAAQLEAETLRQKLSSIP